MSEPKEQPNPYNNRNHEGDGQLGRDDILAVAGLLGNVSSSLDKIDQQNVGGVNQFIKAKKIDPKQVLKNMVGETTHTPPVQHSVAPQQPAQQPMVSAPLKPTQQHNTIQSDNQSLEKRVIQLEKVIENYKKITKFKRGVSYTINTAKISGEFKDPIDIIDIITTELAKQTKSITLKLNDNTKN